MLVASIFNIVLSAFFSNRLIWVLAIILLILIVILSIYLFYIFGFRKYMINRSKRQETWLPVVDDMGNIIGRVAQSVSLENPGKFQHPLIRLIVWCDNKVYLKPRQSESLFENGKIDHFFELALKYGKSIEETLEDILKRCFPDCDKPIFLLNYSYENPEGRWQIILYYLNILDESKLNAIKCSEGKLWPMQQIKGNLGKAYFSDIFENELKFFSEIFKRN